MLSTATDLDLRSLSRLFRALGDETRLRIVALLAHGELCVCHVEQALGLSQPNASRQLGILKLAGVVDSRRDGTWVYYRIAEQEHEQVARVLALLTDSLGARRALRTDLVRLRRSCGPDACK
ncbi:MAG TPA: metalloregulator ArsR/SmtB family transcription factor [Kofleriaceae bacterium]|nr:metalloregulator ArsR/SmtB family transcription factor [Kofleriaceae bacterium]